MADHGGRLQAPAQQQLRQRVLHREDCRLGEQRCRELLWIAAIAGIEQAAQVEPELGFQQIAAQVDRTPECWLAGIELPRHLRILRALAGKHEDEVAGAGHGCGTLSVLLAQGNGGLGMIAGDYGETVREGPSASLQGEGDVGEALFRLGFEMLRQPVSRFAERRSTAGRERQELVAAGGSRGFARGGLLQHEVDIGSAEAEGADAGPAWPGLFGPFLLVVGDEERAVGQLQRRIRLRDVQARRQYPALHREGGLDQPGDAGGGVEMADIGFDRAERAEAAILGRQAKGGGEAGDLDRIAHRRAGAVALDIADRARVDVGGRMRHGDRRGLAVDARRGEADLACAVIVDADAANDGVDLVAICNRIFQPLQHDESGAAAEDRAAGAGVEGTAMAVRGDDAALLGEIAAALRKGDRDAAGQGHVAAMAEQALHGLRHCQQRGRARRLDGDAGAGQAELVADPRRGEIRGRADQQRQVADLEARGVVGERRAVVQQVLQQIGAGGGAGENADALAGRGRVVAGILERFPGAFQQQPLLRIGECGLARHHAEEGCVELVDAVEHGLSRDEVRERARRSVESVLEFGGVEPRDRLHPIKQILPERADIRCAGEAAGQADDRDGALGK